MSGLKLERRFLSKLNRIHSCQGGRAPYLFFALNYKSSIGRAVEASVRLMHNITRDQLRQTMLAVLAEGYAGNSTKNVIEGAFLKLGIISQDRSFQRAPAMEAKALEIWSEFFRSGLISFGIDYDNATIMNLFNDRARIEPHAGR